MIKTQLKLAWTKIKIYWLLKCKIPGWVLNLDIAKSRSSNWTLSGNSASLSFFSVWLSWCDGKHSHWQPWTRLFVLLTHLSKKTIFTKNSNWKTLGRALVHWLGSWTNDLIAVTRRRYSDYFWLNVHSFGWPKWESAQQSHVKCTLPQKRDLDSWRKGLRSFQQERNTKLHFSDLSQIDGLNPLNSSFQKLLEI